MKETTKKQSFANILRQRIANSNNLELVSAEKFLRTLLLSWLAIRICVAVYTLIYAANLAVFLQEFFAVLFAFGIYSNRKIVFLPMLGGVLSIFSLLYNQIFQYALVTEDMLLFFSGILVVVTSIAQIAIMVTILAAKRLTPLYSEIDALRQVRQSQAKLLSQQRKLK